MKLWVRCPANYGEQNASGRLWDHYLPMRKSECYCLQKTNASKQFGTIFKGFARSDESKKNWIIAWVLCLWVVEGASSMQQGARRIDLEAGEVFFLTDLIKDDGGVTQAKARSWTNKTGPVKEGTIDLNDPNLRPVLCVHKDYPNGVFENVVEV